MRNAILSFTVLLLTGAAALAEAKTISFPPGKDAAVTLVVPKTAKVATDNGKTTIDTSKFNLYLWLAPKAKTVDEAVAGVGEIVKSEAINLKIEETKSIKVAGADAKHLMAKSNEADDNDPGTTDIVVFTSGGKVIVGCIHGENDFAVRNRQAMLDMLGTAKAP
jgi:hypothetical protein